MQKLASLLSFLTLFFLMNTSVSGQCFDDAHSINATDAWLSCTGSEAPNSLRGTGHWVMYDLGFIYYLEQTQFWNYNVAGETGKGFKEVSIDYSEDGINWTEGGQFQLAEAPGDSAYEGVLGPHLGTVAARYVLIFSPQSWDNNSCAGLSEFKVSVNPSPDCPQGDSDLDGVCDDEDVCAGGDDTQDADSDGIPDACDVVEVSLKVFLEGAMLMNMNAMRSSLSDNNLLPNQQPYNIAPYNVSSPLNAPNFPAGTVDWVLVEARSFSFIGGFTTEVVETQVGLLMSNGEIKSIDGVLPLRFTQIADGSSYYFVVRHRNHLDVMTAEPLTSTSQEVVYDFTTAETQAFGNEQLKATTNGVYTLFAGDYNHDGVIQTTDYDEWRIDPSVLNAYKASDGNLDGVIQTTDFDTWTNNKAKLGVDHIQF